jgi:hypothetical protein
MTIVRFFDHMEDKVRGWFSRHPFLYAIYGGIGIVLFWRGVWHGMDTIAQYYFFRSEAYSTIDVLSSGWDPLVSFIIGSLILLSCGLFVSELIGKEIIISGLRGEKKLTERTETEVRTETGALAEVLERLAAIAERLEKIEDGHRKEKS